jgi:hypothetical protein
MGFTGLVLGAMTIANTPYGYGFSLSQCVMMDAK